jgi:hypothetical protein
LVRQSVDPFVGISACSILACLPFTHSPSWHGACVKSLESLYSNKLGHSSYLKLCLSCLCLLSHRIKVPGPPFDKMPTSSKPPACPASRHKHKHTNSKVAAIQFDVSNLGRGVRESRCHKVDRPVHGCSQHHPGTNDAVEFAFSQTNNRHDIER